jgi:oligopeptide transport system substrate-binding protein
MNRLSFRTQALALAGAIVLLGLLSGAVWLAVDSGPVRAEAPASALVASGGNLRYYSAEPAQLDPVLSGPVNELRIIAQIFEGLVRLDDNFTPQPALASSWSLAPDASVYTFTLDTAYFSNGRLVVADDVVYSIMRAISPTINNGSMADYAGMLYDIEGAQEYAEGDTSVPVGVEALNPATVRMDLVGTVPPNVFLKKLAMWIADVLPAEEIAAGGPEWWRDPDHCIGTGPFKLAEWVAGDHLSLVPNRLHHAGPPLLRHVEARFLADVSAALAAYQQNQLDLFEPSASQVVTITADPILASQFITRAGTCTFWSILDNQKEPFSGTLGMTLRQAFNYAIDKTDFISTVMGGVGVPARGLIPPGMYGHNPALEGLDFDVVSATLLLAASGYTGTPEIIFRYTDNLPNLRRAENLRDQLLDNLGVSIVLSTTATSYQMRIYGWCADYPDPSNWFPHLLRSDGWYNRTHYNNPVFDALIDQAATTLTEAERLDLYHQAEQIAVSEAAELPLWHDQAMFLKKPWVSDEVILDLQWSQPFSDVTMAVQAVYLPLVLKGD